MERGRVGGSCSFEMLNRPLIVLGQLPHPKKQNQRELMWVCKRMCVCVFLSVCVGGVRVFCTLNTATAA